MNYNIYKLKFLSQVHFGMGSLSTCSMCFPSDRLFSALFTEGVKSGDDKAFHRFVESSELLFSDCFPYIADTFFIPKPIIHINENNADGPGFRKIFKKLKYIPMEKLGDFAAGRLTSKDALLISKSISKIGKFSSREMVYVNTDGDPLPYYVGTFSFSESAGLYILTASKNDNALSLFEKLLKNLSFKGIGGKLSQGLGGFSFSKAEAEVSNLFKTAAEKESGKYMLMSSALPEENELTEELIGKASYLLEKRSGFIQSDTFDPLADRKKRDIYMFSSGSCFDRKFSGDIFDVSAAGGTHPVYRCGKALFIGA